MIYLSAEVVSGLGEDTFWTWFQREFPTSTFKPPTQLNDSDVILRYSTLGGYWKPGKSVGLMWELHPEMKRVYQSSEWDLVLARIYECAVVSTFRVVASPYMLPFYQDEDKGRGKVQVLPIGVNTDLFRPMEKKAALRSLYGVPQNKRVGFWCGTKHPMKGFAHLEKYAKEHPEIYWIIVWKDWTTSSPIDWNHHARIPQANLAELMNCADFFACTGNLKPFFMVEWEAMACDLPFLMLTEREFIPMEHSREDVFRLKWDRPSTKRLWEQYLGERGVTW